MLRTLTKFSRFIKNYRYYRKLGFYSHAAWQLASRTLPE
jgi:hypothetical protein